jgi:hypothetical protein
MPSPPWVDAVWFIGVWERSTAGIEISLRNQELVEAFSEPSDFTAVANVGRHTACAATLSTSTSAGRRGSPRRE